MPRPSRETRDNTANLGFEAKLWLTAPCKGRVYDPTCGSGAMLVQPGKFVESHA